MTRPDSHRRRRSTGRAVISYYLGIDLGTTYTSAAVWRGQDAEVANLGNRAPVIPSVLFLRDDGEFLVGEAAQRRADAAPEQVAREFKRRLGDPTPLILGGTPCAADLLTAKLLRWVVDKVAEAEGGPADGTAVTHPANWGDFKTDLLQQAIRRADLEHVELLTEPEAAAIHYASQERVPIGSTVAVYDLGGGTFDAAVLRRATVGWDILGVPEGIENLGGVDFDAAVFQHVLSQIGDAGTRLGEEDPATVSAMARLRQDCVAAKEALSADTDTSIPVLLPDIRTEVRLTRVELEDMIRPALRESTAALGRAVRSAGLDVTEIDTVLLVGGSSRIPLVAQLVGSDLGRPVAVDAHPKHGVALGAAAIAAQRGAPPGAPGPTSSASPAPAPPSPAAPPSSPATAPPQLQPEPESDNDSNLPAYLALGAVAVVLAVFAFLLVQALSGGGSGDDGDDGDDERTADPAAQTRDVDEDPPATADEPPPTTEPPAAEADEPEEDEPEDLEEAPLADAADGPTDLLRGDATPAFDAFATLHGGDPRVLEITLYPDYAFVAVQVPDEPQYADRYQWRGGQLGEPDDWSAFFDDEDDLFNFSEVDPSLLPDMASRALDEIGGEGMAVTHVIVDKTFSSAGTPEVRVYVSNPDRTGSGGYVTFGLDGTHVDTYAG